MKIVLDDIVDKKVYPVIVKNCGQEFLTLYYYNFKDDALLHSDRHLVCFENYGELQSFCTEYRLCIEQAPYTFDFDLPIVNPMNYGTVLTNWNLLNTISNLFQMHFEGNEGKYTPLYELLFRYNTSVAPCPPIVQFSEKINKQLLRVFRKKNRLLNRFVRYSKTAI